MLSFYRVQRRRVVAIFDMTFHCFHVIFSKTTILHPAHFAPTLKLQIKINIW